jgi:hypothetical protein
MQAVACDDDIATLRRKRIAASRALEVGSCAAAILVEAGACPTGKETLLADTLYKRGMEDHLQILSSCGGGGGGKMSGPSGQTRSWATLDKISVEYNGTMLATNVIQRPDGSNLLVFAGPSYDSWAD